MVYGSSAGRSCWWHGCFQGCSLWLLLELIKACLFLKLLLVAWLLDAKESLLAQIARKGRVEF